METATTVQEVFTALASDIASDMLPIVIAGAGVLAFFLAVRYGKRIFNAVSKG